ncbi:MAG: hypothetical protein JW749_03435 [Sedimentisphaerales bacterium]|nr:hypothetical protein [Sedimentisphaerales bacterium]
MKDNGIESKFTSEAQRRWDKVSKQSQGLILNNVWCGGCLGPVPINLQSGEMKKDLLALKGTCRICGKNIARAVEPEGV